VGLVQLDPPPPAAVLRQVLPASVLDEDSPHRFRRGSEEVSSTIPPVAVDRPDQA
jgi:hypothetical protein